MPTRRPIRNPDPRTRRREFSDVPSIPMDADAKRVLATFVAARGKTAERAIKARYDFSLMSDDGPGWGDRTFRFAIKPKDGRELHSMWSHGRGPRLADNEVQYTYRTPPDSIDDVPEIDGMAYRGMSYEEWQAIRKHCVVRSRGEWNIGQDDLTFFGAAAKAQHYAVGFAPWMFYPSKRRPSIVIAIPKKYTLDHRDIPKLIPEGELAIRGALSASMIEYAWRVVPTLIQGGFQEITALHLSAMERRQHPRGKIEEGRGRSPSIREFTVVPSSLRELDRCATHENPSRRRR